MKYVAMSLVGLMLIITLGCTAQDTTPKTTPSNEWKEFTHMCSESMNFDYPPDQKACEHYWEFSAPWEIDEGMYRFTLTELTVEEGCKGWYIKFTLIIGDTESKPVCLDDKSVNIPLKKDMVFWEFETPENPTLKLEIYNVKTFDILIEERK